MDALTEICGQHRLFLIEDCAQAHGAVWKGQMAGSFVDAAAFSFCTDKIMSTGGEGGMLFMRAAGAWARAWSWKGHGKNPPKVNDPFPGQTFPMPPDGLAINYTESQKQPST